MKDIKKEYDKILKLGHEDYKEMKESMGWHNIDVAKIVGYKHMSVKNQTRTSTQLPIWAQMLVYLWRQEYRKDKYDAEGKQVEKFMALVAEYKAEFTLMREQLADHKKQIELLGLELRKEQRKNKKLSELVAQLEKIEFESEVDMADKPTAGVMKREISSLNSKHNRKMKVLKKIKAIDGIDPKPTKGTKKGVTTPVGTNKSTRKGRSKSTVK